MKNKFIEMPVSEFVDRHVIPMITQRKLTYYYRDPEKYPDSIYHEVRWVKGGWLMFTPDVGRWGEVVELDKMPRNRVLRTALARVVRREYEGNRKNWNGNIYLKV